MIPFNVPVVIGDEKEYLNQVFLNKKFSGKGKFTKECQQKLIQILQSPESKALLTTSCTDALEMAAILADIQPGDEVIMPSFTFVSSANAFVLRGAKIKFVDVDSESMNVDFEAVQKAVTSKTKVILVVHYAGMCCDMAAMKKFCQEKGLILIEDAAQALKSSFNGQALGTFGDLACFSFHDTKNFHCGEGGALIVNNAKFSERAEVIIEKGTDRSKFLNGVVDKYTWLDIGSSFLLSELNAAFLYAQLPHLDMITKRRLEIWNQYFEKLSSLKAAGKISIIEPTKGCQHNAHLFGIILESKEVRVKFIEHMKKNEIAVVPHYIPLHSSPAGKKFGEFVGEDENTTDLSERLVRLPLFYELKDEEIRKVSESITNFFC